MSSIARSICVAPVLLRMRLAFNNMVFRPIAGKSCSTSKSSILVLFGSTFSSNSRSLGIFHWPLPRSNNIVFSDISGVTLKVLEKDLLVDITLNLSSNTTRGSLTVLTMSCAYSEASRNSSSRRFRSVMSSIARSICVAPVLLRMRLAFNNMVFRPIAGKSCSTSKSSILVLFGSTFSSNSRSLGIFHWPLPRSNNIVFSDISGVTLKVLEKDLLVDITLNLSSNTTRGSLTVLTMSCAYSEASRNSSSRRFRSVMSSIARSICVAPVLLRMRLAFNNMVFRPIAGKSCSTSKSSILVLFGSTFSSNSRSLGIFHWPLPRSNNIVFSDISGVTLKVLEKDLLVDITLNLSSNTTRGSLTVLTMSCAYSEASRNSSSRRFRSVMSSIARSICVAPVLLRMRLAFNNMVFRPIAGKSCSTSKSSILVLFGSTFSSNSRSLGIFHWPLPRSNNIVFSDISGVTLKVLEKDLLVDITLNLSSNTTRGSLTVLTMSCAYSEASRNSSSRRFRSVMSSIARSICVAPVLLRMRLAFNNMVFRPIAGKSCSTSKSSILVLFGSTFSSNSRSLGIFHWPLPRSNNIVFSDISGVTLKVLEKDLLVDITLNLSSNTTRGSLTVLTMSCAYSEASRNSSSRRFRSVMSSIARSICVAPVLLRMRLAFNNMVFRPIAGKSCSTSKSSILVLFGSTFSSNSRSLGIFHWPLRRSNNIVFSDISGVTLKVLEKDLLVDITLNLSSNTTRGSLTVLTMSCAYSEASLNSSSRRFRSVMSSFARSICCLLYTSDAAD